MRPFFLLYSSKLRAPLLGAELKRFSEITGANVAARSQNSEGITININAVDGKYISYLGHWSLVRSSWYLCRNYEPWTSHCACSLSASLPFSLPVAFVKHRSSAATRQPWLSFQLVSWTLVLTSLRKWLHPFE